MDTLDIAISFLKSVGADPESLLNDFIVNILKIDHFYVSQKVILINVSLKKMNSAQNHGPHIKHKQISVCNVK